MGYGWAVLTCLRGWLEQMATGYNERSLDGFFHGFL